MLPRCGIILQLAFLNVLLYYYYCVSILNLPITSKEVFMKKFILALLLAVSFTSMAMAHSGGTDANGCHTNSKTGDYHCHKSKN